MDVKVKGTVQPDGIRVDPTVDQTLVIYNAENCDLGKIAAYFEGQAWHESWPAGIIFALARLNYPSLAPFTIVWGGTNLTEEQATASDEMFYMMDVRDKNGDKLPG